MCIYICIYIYVLRMLLKMWGWLHQFSDTAIHPWIRLKQNRRSILSRPYRFPKWNGRFAIGKMTHHLKQTKEYQK